MSFIYYTPGSSPRLFPKFPPGPFRKPGFLPSRRKARRGSAAGPPEGAQRAGAVMAAARVLLLLSGRLESVSFAQSVCGLLGAGSGLGPWPTHCGLNRGQLVLSDKPFPGASARLPLQVGRRGRDGAGAGPKEGTGSGGGELEARGLGRSPASGSSSSFSCDVNPSGSLPPATPFLPFCGPGPTAQGSGGRAAPEWSRCGSRCGGHSAVQRSDCLVDAKDKHPQSFAQPLGTAR